MIKSALSIIIRDCQLALRQGSGVMMVLGFFIIVVSFFPFALGPAPVLLGRVAVGVIWVAALLSCLLSLDRLFQADYEDGALDQFMISPLPLALIVLAKCLAHWVTTAVPLIVVAPVLGLMMHLPTAAYLPLFYTMLIGTPALSFIGSMGAAFTAGMRRGGVLLSLLVLPFYIPVLIFAVLAVEAAVAGQAASPHIMLLTAFTLFSMVLSPWISAAALK